jgi:hypothetical protein
MILLHFILKSCFQICKVELKLCISDDTNNCFQMGMELDFWVLKLDVSKLGCLGLVGLHCCKMA